MVGYHAEERGRRPLLLIGFALEPVRALLLAFTAEYPVVLVAQPRDGISDAIVTILTVLVITDLTTGTGRFNLARGTVVALSGIAGLGQHGPDWLCRPIVWTRDRFFADCRDGLRRHRLLWNFQAETKFTRYLD